VSDSALASMLLVTVLWSAVVVIICLLIAAGVGYVGLRRRGMDKWIGTYVRESRRRDDPPAGRDVHVLLCIADHYEPRHGKVDPQRAMARVQTWVREYPRLLGGFHDSDGRPPRHTFFYPMEEYDRAEMDEIAGLCRQGYGEVEVHLHHDKDTAENLRRTLLEHKAMLAERHGMLARRRSGGEVAYGFVHGNWALDNSRPDGRWCGVNDELDVLRETGCYADFTMPSSPSTTQTRKINSIYYAIDDPGRPKSHDWGMDVGSGPRPPGSLLLVQGPLLLDWRRRVGGIIPRVENGCIQANQAPSAARLDLWLKARVRVPARPDWYFVKVYTHGAPEENAAVLLGEPTVRFHEALAARAARDRCLHFHYVTAREMYNLIRAAEDGFDGPVAQARDYEMVWNGTAAAAAVTVAPAVAAPGVDPVLR
jgi:hypothetical protein